MISLPRTSLSRFHERFRRFEQEFDVFSITEAGIPVWERIRLPVSNELKHKIGISNPPKMRGQTNRYLKMVSLLLQNAVYRNPFLASEHNFLVWGHQRRKQHDEGFWWDVYCDPIYDALDLDHVHFESDHRFMHHRPAPTNNLRYLDLVKFGGALLNKLGVGTTKLSSKTQARLAELEAAIVNQFDVAIELQNRIQKLVGRDRVMSRLYDRILARVDPDVAIVIVAYGKESFIDTCKRHDVPVVELQHGVLNEYHYGYDFPANSPKQTFPDYLFTFGSFWNDQASFPIPDENVIPVGYPYLEMQREAVEDHSDRDKLLFVSSGHNVGKPFSRIASDVSTELETDIIYKLHPNEYDFWPEQYPWLVESDVQVVDTDSPSLYELFAQSNLQVGVSSTAVFEGLTFGLPTYIVELPGAEYFKDSIKREDAKLVRSAEDLVDAIRSSWSPTVDGRDYFLNDPIRRIDDALTHVIRKE